MTQVTGMTTLSEIVKETNALTQHILDNGGELSPELEEALLKVDLSMAVKIEGYAHLISRMEMEASYFSAKAQALSRIARSHERVVDRLWQRIKEAMIETERTELEGETVVYKLIKGKPKLIINENLLGSEYKDKVVIEEVNKDRVKEALDSGEMLDGARYEGGFTLRCVNKKGTK